MEVEIKLHVQHSAAVDLFRHLSCMESLAGHPLGEVEPVAVRDIYYDTPDGALAHVRAGLRLRVENGISFITLKVSRQQKGALTAREEYEYPLDDYHLQEVLRHIRPVIGSDPVPLADFAAGRAAGPLQPVLDVVTQRLARSVGTVAMLTLDRVEYPGLSAQAFYDIEVEANTGLGGEAALRLVEAELIRLAGASLTPADQSKLERGLWLRAQTTTHDGATRRS